MQAATIHKGLEKMSLEEKVQQNIFQEILDPTIHDRKSQSCEASNIHEDWNALEDAFTESLKCKVEEQGETMILHVSALFDSFNPVIKKGMIDGELFVLKNSCDVIEYMIPGRIKQRRLCQLRAGNIEFDNIQIQENEVFFEAIQWSDKLQPFEMVAIYKAL